MTNSSRQLPGKRTSIYFLSEDEWTEYQMFLVHLKMKGTSFSDWVREKLREEIDRVMSDEAIKTALINEIYSKEDS